MKIAHMVKSYFLLNNNITYITLYIYVIYTHIHPDWGVVINPLIEIYLDLFSYDSRIPGFQDSHYDTDGHKSYTMFCPIYTHGKG